jgi:hypothetical protein
MLPRPWDAFPIPGRMHRWFPAVVIKSQISVSIMLSNCTNFVGAVRFEPTNPSLVRRKLLTKRSSSQSRLHALDLRKPRPEMPRDAWESLHGGSRKWFPEQRPRSPESGTEQRLPAPLPITGTSAPTSLKHQVRTAARPSMPKPGQDSRQRHRPNSDRHQEWTPRSVDKRVLALPADYYSLMRARVIRPATRRLSDSVSRNSFAVDVRSVAIRGAGLRTPLLGGGPGRDGWRQVPAGRLLCELLRLCSSDCAGRGHRR